MESQIPQHSKAINHNHEQNSMGKHNDAFAPLEPQQARELEFTINEAAKQGQAVIIDPNQGISGRKATSLISPTANTNGLVRYGRHFNRICW